MNQAPTFEDISRIPWRLEHLEAETRLLLGLHPKSLPFYNRPHISTVFGPATKSVKWDLLASTVPPPGRFLAFSLIETPRFDDRRQTGAFCSPSETKRQESVLKDWYSSDAEAARVAEEIRTHTFRFWALAVEQLAGPNRFHCLLPLDARNERQAKECRGDDDYGWFILELIDIADYPWVDHPDAMTKKLPMKGTYISIVKRQFVGVCAHGGKQVALNHMVRDPDFDERLRIPVWERIALIENPAGGIVGELPTPSRMSHEEQHRCRFVALPGDGQAELKEYGGWRGAGPAKKALRRWPGRWLLVKRTP